MPRRLLDLPQDVLDSCLENLLLPLDSCVRLHRRDAIPIPGDLHRVQLVCKRLYSVALPWAWRRIAMNVRANGETRTNYPERFAHVRLFKLDVTRFTDDDVIAILPRLKRCIAFMDKLQVLILNGKEFPGRELVDQVYFALTSKPRLHTLLVSSYAPRKLPSLTSLKRLIIYDVQLSLVAPALESLAMFCKSAVPGLSPLPWETLRDVGLYNFHGLRHVLQDFSKWREAFPDIHSPLQDIYMDLGGILSSDDQFRREEVQRILDVLKDQNIRRLLLLGLPEVEWNLIHNVAEAFPRLQELTITQDLVSEGNTPWTVAEALGRFPLLKYLGWHLTDCRFQPKIRDHWSRILMDLIAQRCPVVEIVTLMSLDKCSHVTYDIKRDDAGRYIGGVVRDNEGGYVYNSYIHLASSWCSAKYDNI